MKLSTKTAAICLAVLISSPVYAAAPVTDATIKTASNAELLKRIEDLTRVMTVRNRMQVRFQSQLDELGQEVSEMKGSLELFENQLSQIENRQRTLFQMLEESKSAAPVQPPAVPLVTSGAEGTSGLDKAAYEAAYGLLTAKRFDESRAAFSAFIADYSESTYIPNAQYWLGQLLTKAKKHNEARAAFLVVTDKYPDSNKRADSLYKIGIIDEYGGKIDSAKSFYNKVIAEYPGSSAAGLASNRLKSL